MRIKNHYFNQLAIRQERLNKAVELSLNNARSVYHDIISVLNKPPLTLLHVHVCEDCGYESLQRSDFLTFEGDLLCEDCYDQLSICEYDNETRFRDEDGVRAYRVTNSYDWESIIIAPDNVEYFVETTSNQLWQEGYPHVRQLADGGYISYRQWENGGYDQCYDCDGIFDTDDMMYDEHEENYYCDCCHPRNHRPDSIRPYSHRPQPIYHHIDGTMRDAIRNTLYLGFETEIDKLGRGELRYHVAQEVLDRFPTLFYNKEDGSLHDGGFEIVSHPATYEYLYSIKEKIASLFKYLSNEGARSHDTSTCGLHIHISRSSFKDETAQNNFVYIAEKFIEQIFTFSRRTREKFNDWAKSYNIFKSTEPSRVFREKLKGQSTEKYRIVNLQHGSTLEVRAFRGTLNIDTWFASAQLLLVMHKIANQNDLVVDNVTWQSIVRLARVEGYTELTDYLVKRKLDTVRTERVKFEAQKFFKAGTKCKVVNALFSSLEEGALVTVVSHTTHDNCVSVSSDDYGIIQYFHIDDLQEVV